MCPRSARPATVREVVVHPVITEGLTTWTVRVPTGNPERITINPVVHQHPRAGYNIATASVRWLARTISDVAWDHGQTRPGIGVGRIDLTSSCEVVAVG